MTATHDFSWICECVDCRWQRAMGAINRTVKAVDSLEAKNAKRLASVAKKAKKVVSPKKPRPVQHDYRDPAKRAIQILRSTAGPAKGDGGEKNGGVGNSKKSRQARRSNSQKRAAKSK